MWRLATTKAVILWVLLVGGGAARASVPEAPWAQGESRPEDLSVFLVTFGPGDEIISWFGHSALVVRDTRLQHERLYNYGMFSFDPTMLARFATGRLTFWVGEASVEGSLQFYREAGRDVRLIELNLPPSARAGLAKALAENIRPQNREYLYHHYFDNCATRPRDMIDRAVRGALKAAAATGGRMTLREHTRRHSANSPMMSVLLDFLMNDEIDAKVTPWEEAFLPEELEAQVQRLHWDDGTGQKVPLAKRTWTYFKATRPQVPDSPPALLPLLGLGGLCLGALSLVLASSRALSERRRQQLWGGLNVGVGLVAGLPGTVLFLMSVATNHSVTFWNENLFLANPLTLLALPLGWKMMCGSSSAKGRLRWVWYTLSGLSLLGAALKAHPLFNQDNVRLMALLLPVNLGMAGAFFLDARTKKAVEKTQSGGSHEVSVASGR